MIVLELILLTIAIVCLLSLVGLGPVLLLVPDLGGVAITLAPFVGLAIMYWACQWLSPYVASGSIIIGVCIGGSALSAGALWTRRTTIVRALSSVRVDLGILAAVGMANALLLQLPAIHTGILTLSDFSGDDLFTWAPSAAYMQTHAYVTGHSTAYVSPLLWVLPTNIYPGSAGTVDGGLMTVLGLHSYQFVEPFSAVCLALEACGAYIILKWILQTPRLVAVLGVVLVSSNQFRFFTAGAGLAQSTRGTALMMGSIILILFAISRKSIGAAVLGGATAALLVGVYMPAFLVAGAAAMGAAAVAIVALIRRRPDATQLRVALALVVSGIVFGLQNLRWLVFEGGIHAWVLQTSYGPQVFVSRYGFPYLAGTAPVQYLYWRQGVAPWFTSRPLFWNHVLATLAVGVGALAIILVLAGIAYMILDKKRLIAATLGAPFLYGAFVFVDNRGGFGSLLSVVYLTPLACIFAAYASYRALLQIRARSAPRHSVSSRNRRFAVVGLCSAVALVMSFEMAASAEDENYFVHQSGMLTSTNLRLVQIASVIPKGSSVFMYAASGSNGYATLAKTEALVGAASFLPNRNITIAGSYFTGTFKRTDAVTIRSLLAIGYPFILHDSDPSTQDPPIPPGYHAVWRFTPDHLVLYERTSK